MNKTRFLWIYQRLPLFHQWFDAIKRYHVPKNLNFLYCFGVLALFAFVLQWVSGFWLSMFYTPAVSTAFDSIENIMREVHWGWLIRYVHSTGASAIFIVLYLHIFRGLLYGSYKKPRELVWLLGCFLFTVLMLEAFMGYVLPWGQMSYWSAQVLTSLLGVIPFVGDVLMQCVRGGDGVGEETLHRMYSAHVIAAPLVVMLVIYLHIKALHHVGSNNPLGIELKRPEDWRAFYPYFVWKDLLAIVIYLIIFFAIVFFCPDFNGYFLESANFAAANRFKTPANITPMWYLSPFYAMLRVIPHPLGGLFVMLSALGLLYCLPWLDQSKVRATRYKGVYSRIALIFFVVSFLVLGYLGLQPITPFRKTLAQIATCFYLAYFLLMPFYTRFEQARIPPEFVCT